MDNMFDDQNQSP